MNKELLAKLKYKHKKGSIQRAETRVGNLEGTEILSKHVETRLRKPKSIWN